ncbi:MAG TPA: hypothetical protein VGQ26_08200 [Streptosporangiaceae bacterium]|jgi:hypothetical protein|nr:hypothetical protein [Streptosporangiaceae bacterium]
MSLPARQQRKLREIEGGLTGSDPRLRSLFGIFTRLTTGEAMPWFEAVPTRPVADALAAFRSLIRRIARRPASRVRALLLLPAALSAMVCGIMIAAGLSGAQRPAHASAKPPAARELILKTSRICRLGMIRYPALAC